MFCFIKNSKKILFYLYKYGKGSSHTASAKTADSATA